MTRSSDRAGKKLAWQEGGVCDRIQSLKERTLKNKKKILEKGDEEMASEKIDMEWIRERPLIQFNKLSWRNQRKIVEICKEKNIIITLVYKSSGYSRTRFIVLQGRILGYVGCTEETTRLIREGKMRNLDLNLDQIQILLTQLKIG